MLGWILLGIVIFIIVLLIIVRAINKKQNNIARMPLEEEISGFRKFLDACCLHRS